MRVKFLTLGCKVNQVESEAMQRLFEMSGHEAVDELESADAVVVNTCAVTAVAAQKSRQMLRRASRGGALVAVVGCYAQENPSEIDADIVIGTKDRAQIVELVEKVIENKNKIPPARPQQASPSTEEAPRLHSENKFNIVGGVGTEFEELPNVIPSRTRAFIKIEDGCDNRCAYCIIPTLRGAVRSRSLDSIRAECDQLRTLGFREIVLTGIHLGAYGKDHRLQLLDAVNVVLDAAKPRRLRLSSIEATEVRDELIELLKNDRRLCRHLHLPLQSGCDKTLRAMRRPYSARRFASLVERLAVEIPDISITTDLIVGFPGETEQDFLESSAFVEALPINRLHVFPYSVRRGTVAASMPDQIDPTVKRERVARMLELSDRKSIEFRRRMLGSTVEVLTETFTDGVVDGLADNYVRVFIDGDIPRGEFVEAKIVGLERDGVKGTVTDRRTLDASPLSF